MFRQFFNCPSIQQVDFFTAETLDTPHAKEYATQELRKGSYQNCTIGKVYVNGELVLENVTVS